MTPKLIWGGLLAACLTNVAHAAIEKGVSDPVTGQEWIRADTLEQGEALGYRAATTAEFSAYLTHGGFGNPSTTQEFFSRSVTSPLMDFTADISLEPAMFGQYGGPNVVMGWLDGSKEQVGAIMHTWGRQLKESEDCWYANSPACYTIFQVNEAAYGTLSEFVAGQHDRYAYGVGGDWAPAARALTQSSGSYYMLSAVPEPSTYALMGIGWLLITCATRKRRA